MKNLYILEHAAECERLNQQSEIEQFSIADELKKIKFPEVGNVLDAGCGSGLAARYIKEVFPTLEVEACDSSEARIADAMAEKSEIYYYHADISELDKLGKFYDLILNRYVAHHLNGKLYQKCLHAFYDSLNVQGQVIIIDADGALINIGTTNKKLIKYLDKIKKHFPGDLQQARKIPSMLKSAGFKDIKYDIEVMNFQGSNRIKEIQQYEQRLEFSKDMYIFILGNKSEYLNFKELYLNEIKDSPLFYNKFIITALKF